MANVFQRFSGTLTFLLLTLSAVSGYLDTDGWINIELHHAVNCKYPENLSYRGNVSIPSLTSGLSNIVQLELSDEEQNNLEVCAAQDGFYKLQATVVYANGLKQTFVTSTKSCNLIESQLNDFLWIAIDGTGSVLSVTQTVAVSSLTLFNCTSYKFASIAKEFNTDILIRHTELAPIPDTASFIQKIEREREAREKGETRDNRGFFAKYWMYIVPVVLLVFISGASNQDAAK